MSNIARNTVFIIAEIGNSHDGSLGIAHSYIDAAAETGVDAVKFQTHIAEAESSIHEPFRVNFSYEDKTRFDYWKRIEFTLEQWLGLKKHAEEAGLEFLSSPFSSAAVDLLEEIGMNKYKIGSGEVSNFLMLEKIARTGKEIILSSGMSSYSELDETVDFINSFGNKLSILQCTTKYPTSPDDIGLNVMLEMKERYSLPVGLSDHSGTIYPALAAAALGASIIEVHVAFDKRMFGPDSRSSLTLEESKQMVEGIRFIEKMLNSPIDKGDNSQYSDLKRIFEKSLSMNINLEAGSVLTFEDLESKKPLGFGIPAKEFRNIIGMKLKNNKNRYDFLLYEDIE